MTVDQNRLLLWVVYAVSGFALYVVFGGWGHGSFAPMAVFFSWGYLLLFQLGFLVEKNEVAMLAAFLLASVGYVVVLCIGSRRLVAWRGRSWYLVAVGAHITGAVVAQSIRGNGHLATQGLVLQSYIWSIAALLLFFVLDYWLVAGQVHTTAGK